MKRSRWPLVIGGMLGAQALASAFFVYLATSDPSFAVEKDYYQKALQWDQARAGQAASRRLGWQVSVRLHRPTDGASALELSLTDTSGAAVDGATTHVEAFAIARADEVFEIELEAAGDGLYRGRLPVRRGGRWELRLSADRGDQRYLKVLELFVDPTVGGRVSG